MPIYHDIVLTDLRLHIAKRRKPLSFIRTVLKTIRSGKPRGRYYQNGILLPGKDGRVKFRIPISPEIQAEAEAAKRRGEIVRILAPKGGIPVYAGEDTIEFVKAHRKRGDLPLTFPPEKLS